MKQAKLTKAERDKLSRPGSIGQMEALAGLDSDHASRYRFWCDCDAEARRRYRVEWANFDQVVAVARERCHALTAQRLRAGLLSLIRPNCPTRDS